MPNKKQVEQNIIVNFALKGNKKVEQGIAGMDQQLTSLSGHIETSFSGKTLNRFNKQITELRKNAAGSADKVAEAFKALKVVEGKNGNKEVYKEKLALYNAEVKALALLQTELKALQTSTNYTTVQMVEGMNNVGKSITRTSRGALQPFVTQMDKMRKDFEGGKINVTQLKTLTKELDSAKKAVDRLNANKVEIKGLDGLSPKLKGRIEADVQAIETLLQSVPANSKKATDAITKLENKVKVLGEQSSTSMKNSIKQFELYAAEAKKAGNTAFNKEVGTNRGQITKGTGDKARIDAVTAAMKDNLKASQSLALIQEKLAGLSGKNDVNSKKLVTSLTKLKTSIAGGAGFKELSVDITKTNNLFKTLSNSVGTSTEKMSNDILDMTAALKASGVEVSQFDKAIAQMKSQLASGTTDKTFLSGLKGDLTRVKSQSDAVKKLANDYQSAYNKMESKVISFRNALEQKAKFATTAALAEGEVALKSYEAELAKFAVLQKKATSSSNLSAQQLREHRAELDKTTANIKKFSQAVDQSKRALDKSQSAMKGFRKALGTISLYGGATTVIFKLVEAVQALTEAAIEYDKAWRTLAAVTSDAITPESVQAAKALQDEIVQLGITYGIANDELNDVSLELARAGLEMNKLSAATEITIKLAALTGDTVASSTKAIVSYATVFGTAELSVEALGDKLAYVANQSRLSTTDINTFSNYALTAAKSVGLTVDQVGGLAIALSNAGNNASTIGTQIRRFATTLTDTDTSVQAFFQSVGVNQKQLAADIANGTDKSLRDFVSKLADFSTEEFSTATADLGILTKQALQGMRNNAVAINDAISGSLNESVGELEKAEIVTQSLANQLQSLKNEALQSGQAFISVGSAMMKLTETFALGVDGFFTTISTGWERATEAGNTYALQVYGLQTELVQLARDGATALEDTDQEAYDRIQTQIKAKRELLALNRKADRAKGFLNSLVGSLEGGKISKEAFAAIKVLEADAMGAKGQVFEMGKAYQEALSKGDNFSAGQVRKAYVGATNDAKGFAVAAQLAFRNAGQSAVDAAKGLQEYKNLVKSIKSEKLSDNVEGTATAFKVLNKATAQFVNGLITTINASTSAGGSVEAFADSIAYSNIELEKSRTQLSLSAVAQLTNAKALEKSSGLEAAQNIVNSKSLEQVTSAMTSLRIEQKTLTSDDKDRAAEIKSLLFVYEAYRNGLIKVDALQAKLNAAAKKGADNARDLTTEIEKLYASTLKYAGSVAILNKETENEKALSEGPKNLAIQIQDAANAVDALRLKLNGLSGNGAIASVGFDLQQSLENAGKALGKGLSAENISDELAKLRVKKEAGELASTKAVLDRFRLLEAYEKVALDIAKNELASAKAVNKETSLRLKLISATQDLAAKISAGAAKEKDNKTANARASTTLQGPALANFSATLAQEDAEAALVTSQAKVATALEKTGLSAAEAASELEYYQTLGAEGFGDTLTPAELQQFKDLTVYQQTKTVASAKNLALTKATNKQYQAALALQKAQLTAQQVAIVNQSKLAAKNTFGGGVDVNTDGLMEEVAYDDFQTKRIETGFKIQAALLEQEVEASAKRLKISDEEAAQRIMNESQLKLDNANKSVQDAQVANAGGGAGFASEIIGISRDTENQIQLKEQQLMAHAEVLQAKFEMDVAAGGNEKALREQLNTELTDLTAQHLAEITELQVVSAASMAAATFSSLGNSLNDINEAFGNQSKGAFESAKALNIAGATISMFTGAVNAYTTTAAIPVVGTFLAPIAATAALAAGAANIAQIKNQQYKPKTYHTGGPVTRQDAIAAQRGDLRPDEVPATLQTGEYVMSRSEVAAAEAPIVNVDQTPQETIIINTTDDTVMEGWAESRAGRNVINNIVNRS